MITDEATINIFMTRQPYNIKHTTPIDEAKQAAASFAEGLFAYTVDVSLWMTLFILELSPPQSTNGQAFRAQIAADRFLSQWNYESIKRAISQARKNRLIQPIHRGRRALPTITEEGKKRLNSLIPNYDEKRIWDQRMHLVTYDIPEKKKNDRALLRDYLRRIGCGMLQYSVWLTPYNPIDTIRSFIDKHRLTGTVIVSDLGADGSIGEEDLHSLVVRIYRLDRINDRYENWTKDVKAFGRIDHLLLIEYLAILRNDPQLPFPLLPDWWKGDAAYRLAGPKLKELHLRMRPQD